MRWKRNAHATSSNLELYEDVECTWKLHVISLHPRNNERGYWLSDRATRRQGDIYHCHVTTVAIYLFILLLLRFARIYRRKNTSLCYVYIRSTAIFFTRYIFHEITIFTSNEFIFSKTNLQMRPSSTYVALFFILLYIWLRIYH